MNVSRPLYVYATWIFWGVAIYIFLLIFYSPSFLVKYDIRTRVASSFPQGWGFFTKSPIDPMVMVYRRQQKENLLISFDNFSKENLWGFSKKSRAVGIEMAKVLPLIPTSAWRDQFGLANFEGSPTDTIVLKEHLNFFKSGTYIFHYFKTVQFAWTNQNQEQNKPSSIAIVRIDDCE